MVDDTALPKQGTLSVGVARQYCGQLGKQASCQALVSSDAGRRRGAGPRRARLFLPEEWTRDPERCARAGVPEAEVVARSKGEIALAELDRLRAAGVRFGIVLADAGYGASAAFRRGLDERHLLWAVGIPRNQKVYGADVRLVPPGGRKRRPRRTPEPREAETVLAGRPWRRVTWRRGPRARSRRASRPSASAVVAEPARGAPRRPRLAVRAPHRPDRCPRCRHRFRPPTDFRVPRQC